MTVTHTNRKGVTYYLAVSTTGTGKSKFFFTRTPTGRLVREIPEGYAVSESVNGIVSLVRKRPPEILPAEVASVETALKRHPKPSNYRVSTMSDRIEVYERIGTDTEELVSLFGSVGLLPRQALQRLSEGSEQRARYTPVLRFTLVDKGRRMFQAQRMCFGDDRDEWIPIASPAPISRLARDLMPKVGTDDFFELL